MDIETVAQRINAQPKSSDPSKLRREVSGINSLAAASNHEISFLTQPKYVAEMLKTQAAAVIVKSHMPEVDVCQLVHPNPQLAMAQVATMFYRREHGFSGQSPQAWVSPDAKVHPSVTIFPFAFVDAGAEISRGAVLYPHTFVGSNCKIGEDSVLFPQVQLMPGCMVGARCLIFGGTVIGADGFGFVTTRTEQFKIPQMGGVIIEDDVEIGALSTVDRATFGATRIKKGAKLDAHVHIGHNVEIGEHCLLCAQVGVAGTTRIGDRCIAAGQVGFANGIEVGSGLIFGGQAGITRSLSEPGQYHGMPAQPARDWSRQTIALEKLPQLLKRVSALEEELEKLTTSRSRS